MLQSYPEAGTKRRLSQWFAAHAKQPHMEIEARVKGVTQLGFDAVLNKFSSSKEWSNTPAFRDTLDRIHVSGVRETIEMGTASRTFMRKSRVGDFWSQASEEHAVRFAVAEEMPCREDESPVQMFRFKQRITFVRKGMFSFELTRIRDGPSEQMARSGPITHEIELEFCGQRLPHMPNPEYLTDSMLMKVKDVVVILMQAASAPTSAPAAKRARTESGLKEGEQVRVQSEASVALQPAGHSIAVPFDGEMPGELAVTLPWILSHVDKDADGASIAHIMSLPCAIGSKRYPLFFFYGSVPMKHLVTSSAALK